MSCRRAQANSTCAGVEIIAHRGNGVVRGRRGRSGAREEIAAASTDERGGWSLACEKQGAEVLELFQGASVGRQRIAWAANWSGKEGAGCSHLQL